MSAIKNKTKIIINLGLLLVLTAIALLFLKSENLFVSRPVLAAVSDRVVGNPHANVTVIEFSSLTCGVCAKNHFTLRKALAPYLKKDEISYTFRDLTMDENANKLATLSRCISYDKYYDYIAEVFDNPKKFTPIVNDEKNLSFEKNFNELAAKYGLNEKQLASCLANKAMRYDLLKMGELSDQIYDLHLAPTVIIGDRKIEGYRSVDELRAIIDAAFIEATTDFSKIRAY